ncbi:hypothetical protein FRC12_005318 [Ceratobasidium sp. 428]|nr:hypothetical protein FRC12_005318 [Ceratobasidium sp. 428]
MFGRSMEGMHINGLDSSSTLEMIGWINCDALRTQSTGIDPEEHIPSSIMPKKKKPSAMISKIT